MAFLPTTSDFPTGPRAAIGVAAAAGVVAAAVILMSLGDAVIAGAFLAAGLVTGGGVVAARMMAGSAAMQAMPVDWSLAHAIAETSTDAVAITDRAGRLVCANDRYEALFGGLPTPPALTLDGDGAGVLATAGRAAWRDGVARAPALFRLGRGVEASIVRTGAEADMLVWRFALGEGVDRVQQAIAALAGPTGERLSSAGIMAALMNAEGRLLVANRVLRARAFGRDDGGLDGGDFAEALSSDTTGAIRFVREGSAGTPLRVVQIPFAEGENPPILLALLDEEPSAVSPGDVSASAHIRSLVAMLPIGLALVDRDGRFLQMNDAFVRAAAVELAAAPLYPGDLVVREDKAAVADAVRRYAGGASQTADITVRLKDRPDDPVVLTIAGARGLGDAAVLLSLKDNTEESKLKRQAEQATKMQAVGQLAGGVAHDFNNILTAILGHCDLMLMRHSPGDSDYDDIQQIRTNSNRAAGLTRQLLAFSRQQTLRPQVLQLPDVVSEVSNLLKRLLGETVKLDVRHGRNLGPVRADPGQLEQVVVNLAVNARDAMLTKHPQGGGCLTIQTRAVPVEEVRRLGSEILPPADYTALEISDTGTGIPADVLPKIFEPFFTTKEIGKGTGLGLSTVYGIVKQSGGYIFATSRTGTSPAGQGATFTIYLPVHNAAPAPRRPAAPKAKPVETWGTGTVLLVEDEDMVRAVAERALTRQGYTVLAAENGEVALELIAAHPRPDLLISDVVMPMMDGPTMVRRVRERYPDLPILFMSGYAEEQLRRSIDIANVAFLPKPFSVQQLAEAARTALAGRG